MDIKFYGLPNPFFLYSFLKHKKICKWGKIFTINFRCLNIQVNVAASGVRGKKIRSRPKNYLNHFCLNFVAKLLHTLMIICNKILCWVARWKFLKILIFFYFKNILKFIFFCLNNTSNGHPSILKLDENFTLSTIFRSHEFIVLAARSAQKCAGKSTYHVTVW